MGGETGRKTEKLKDGVEKDRNRFCCQMRKKEFSMDNMDAVMLNSPYCPSGPPRSIKCLFLTKTKFQTGAIIPSIKYSAFFEKRIRLRTRLRWTGRKQKYTEADVSAFSREKKFFSSPRVPSALYQKSSGCSGGGESSSRTGRKVILWIGQGPRVFKASRWAGVP